MQQFFRPVDTNKLGINKAEGYNLDVINNLIPKVIGFKMQLDLNHVSHPALSLRYTWCALHNLCLQNPFLTVFMEQRPPVPFSLLFHRMDRAGIDILYLIWLSSFRWVTTAYQRVKAQTMKSKIL